MGGGSTGLGIIPKKNCFFLLLPLSFVVSGGIRGTATQLSAINHRAGARFLPFCPTNNLFSPFIFSPNNCMLCAQLPPAIIYSGNNCKDWMHRSGFQPNYLTTTTTTTIHFFSNFSHNQTLTRCYELDFCCRMPIIMKSWLITFL